MDSYLKWLFDAALTVAIGSVIIAVAVTVTLGAIFWVCEMWRATFDD